jgi:uncharacterized protein (DUF1778 family)
MPSPAIKNNVTLTLQLPARWKTTIKEAAGRLGQSVSEFAAATLLQAARCVTREAQVKRISPQGKRIFMALLDDFDSRPPKALRAALRHYREHHAAARGKGRRTQVELEVFFHDIYHSYQTV